MREYSKLDTAVANIPYVGMILLGAYFIYGGLDIYRFFSWMTFGLVLVFIIESWIILPIVSKKHGCIECPQKDQCPWMGK